MSAGGHTIESITFNLPDKYTQLLNSQTGADNIIALCGQNKQVIVPVQLKVKYVNDKKIYTATTDVIFFTERPDLRTSGQSAFIIVPTAQKKYDNKELMCLLAVADANNSLYGAWFSHLDGCLVGQLPSQTHGYIILKLCQHIAKLLKFSQTTLIDDSKKMCGPFMFSYMKYKLLTVSRTYYETVGYIPTDDPDDDDGNYFRKVIARDIKDVVSRDLVSRDLLSRDLPSLADKVCDHLLRIHNVFLKSVPVFSKSYPHLVTQYATLNRDNYKSLILTYLGQLTNHMNDPLVHINQQLIKTDCLYAVIIDELMSQPNLLFVKDVTKAYLAVCESKRNMSLDLQ